MILDSCQVLYLIQLLINFPVPLRKISMPPMSNVTFLLKNFHALLVLCSLVFILHGWWTSFSWVCVVLYCKRATSLAQGLNLFNILFLVSVVLDAWCYFTNNVQLFFINFCVSIFSIKSIVCLNLPSFSGGFNPWGMPIRRRHNVSSRHHLVNWIQISFLIISNKFFGGFDFAGRIYSTICRRWPHWGRWFQRCLAWACFACAKGTWDSSYPGNKYEMVLLHNLQQWILIKLKLCS